MVAIDVLVGWLGVALKANHYERITKLALVFSGHRQRPISLDELPESDLSFK